MLLELLKMLWSAFRQGKWIPYFLVLPVVLVVCLLYIVGYILLFPLIFVYLDLCARSFRRKAGVFSADGIYFPKAYGRLTIAWSDIRLVVRVRQPKLRFYRIICGIAPADARKYVLSSTPDDDAFERTLHERDIPFRARAIKPSAI